jgi:SAM-dependent methyltransferase
MQARSARFMTAAGSALMFGNTKILGQGALDAIKRSRPIYHAGRSLRFAVGARLGARRVEGISGRVHYNDFMLTSTNPADVAHYSRGATAFAAILERSCIEAGRDQNSITDVLEVGCGYGRIVRELRKRIPSARIHVCDAIEHAARFTATEFGARCIPLLEQAGDKLDGQFDLVYLLSVYTHLRRDMIVANLRKVAAVLKPGGVTVITLQGQGSAEMAERYKLYWLDKAELLQSLARDGYYYTKYPYYYSDYGMTWFSRAAFEQLVRETAPDLSLVTLTPMGLDGHQDVAVYRKAV